MRLAISFRGFVGDVGAEFGFAELPGGLDWGLSWISRARVIRRQLRINSSNLGLISTVCDPESVINAIEFCSIP
jgi:hypothetical protein